MKEFKSFVILIEQFKKYYIRKCQKHVFFNYIKIQLRNFILRLDLKTNYSYWDQFLNSDFEDYKKEIKDYIVIKNVVLLSYIN